MSTRAETHGSDPWLGLTPPLRPGEVNRRRIDADHPLDCFVGTASDGRRVFWLRWEAPDDAGANVLPELPSVAGLDMENVYGSTDDAWRLELSVDGGADIDLLRVLSTDLMAATAGLARGAGHAGMLDMCERLWRWHRLMKAAADEALGPERQIGLYGELLFIERHLLERLAPLDALRAWRGPYGAPRDFDLGTFELELKTLMGPARDAVQVPSLDQLDASEVELVLGCYRLLAERDDPVGDAAAADTTWRSLNQVVESLREHLRLESPAALAILDAGLLEAGWTSRAEYDRHRWRGADLRLWRVDAEFPALGRRGVPQEVTAARYTLDLARCDAWRLDSLPSMRSDRHDG